MNSYQKSYIKFLQKFIKSERALKVVFDCSNGTTGIILEKLFQLKVKSEKLKVILINQNPDGNFPGHGPNPLAKGALAQLQKAVLKSKADFGIIFDADGDRVNLIDDKGRSIDSDIVAYLLIWSLKPKKIVVDVRTGWLVRRGIMNNKVGTKNKNFIIQSKTGRLFVGEKMKGVKGDFGIEKSGHYSFKNFFHLDSGIMSAIEIINAISKLPYKLSDFVDLVPQYYQRDTDIRYGGKIKQDLKKIYKYFLLNTKYKILSTSRLDGLTMEFNDFWFNIRPSNTEPILRLTVEALDKKILTGKTKEITNLIKS